MFLSHCIQQMFVLRVIIAVYSKNEDSCVLGIE